MELGSSGTARQEEESLASGSAQGQALSPQGGQPGWCFCNTGPCRASADKSWRRRGCIQQGLNWHLAALGVVQHGGGGGRRHRGPSTAVAVAMGNMYGLLPGSCLHQAPRSFPGKMKPLCPIAGPFPGRARRMPPRPVMSRQEEDCVGGSWVSGSTCPAARALHNGRLSA